MDWKVPFFDLKFDQKEKNAVKKVLDENWVTSGPKIIEFENLFTQFTNTGVKSAAVSSATAALHLSLLALELKPGDEVILPSLTFVSCANVIKLLQAKPIFADITSENDWSISPREIEKKITKKTKIIMVVHYAGYACNMNKIKKIANKYNLKIIEDCSHAIFSRYYGKTLGTIGDIGCFSFFSNKNITTAEGGMVISKSAKIINKIKLLRSHGITQNTYERKINRKFLYDVLFVGYNYRMDEIRAAIGIEQLKKIFIFNSRREKLVKQYRKKLKNIKNLNFPYKNKQGSFHIFPILLGESVKRENFLEQMSKLGVQCSVHYPAVNEFHAYKYTKSSTPLASKISKKIVTLPLFASMTKIQLNYVLKCVNECLK